jgi:hypothetical protein
MICLLRLGEGIKYIYTESIARAVRFYKGEGRHAVSAKIMKAERRSFGRRVNGSHMRFAIHL